MEKSKLLIKSISKNTTKTTQNWRTQIRHTNLVSQISSILLQRHNWVSLLQTLNLKSELTPFLFNQILSTTKTQPQISLDFFNWAIKNTVFQPDLVVQCRMTHVLICSGLIKPAKPILNSLLEHNPPAQIVHCLIKSCEKDHSLCSSESIRVFDCVLGWYCERGLCFQALEVFNLTRDLTKYLNVGELLSVGSCNTLLNALQENNEVKVGLCYFGVMIRHGVLIDQLTWRIISKIYSRAGKVDAILKIINMGMQDSFMYDLAIECCCKMGMIKVALQLLDEMSKRKLNPGFHTCATILNGACKYKNDEIIKFAMEFMAEKGYISKPLTEHNSLIQKLCDMRKTYAADMFFKTAINGQISLDLKTYGCLLQAFSIETLLNDAIETYQVIKHRGFQLNKIFYNEFINILCDQNPSNELTALLKDMISRGNKPSPSALSKYITSECKKRRWKEAQVLTDLAFQESILIEASCCSILVRHYCKTAQIDLAISMHDEMMKKELHFDSRTYNAILSGLSEPLRIKEGERIFDYMRMQNLLTSDSFVIMINGFSRENELKKAMKLHDEMVEMGLKPSAKMYKRLICNFR